MTKIGLEQDSRGELVEFQLQNPLLAQTLCATLPMVPF